MKKCGSGYINFTLGMHAASLFFFFFSESVISMKKT